MTTIPKQIQDVLDKLHVGGFPSAIVAGGAIRDHLFNKPIKDIDVFVSFEDAQQYVNPWAAFSMALGLVVYQEDWSSYMDIPDVKGVYSVILVGDELPVQIIVMKPGLSPVSRIGLLDFGFCQAHYDGVDIHQTAWFFNDYTFKQITLAHCESQHEFNRSMVRYERLRLKYPEFKLVVPQQYHEYT